MDVTLWTAYEAPAALVAHCRRGVRKAALSAARIGAYDKNDAKALYEWLFEHDAFATYEEWISAGMIAKTEFGDAGLDLWSVLCHEQIIDDGAAAKWDSFASEPDDRSLTLLSLMKRARDAGWAGSVRPSSAAMFDGVAAIAAAAGASLSSGMPTAPISGIPMMAGQAELARLGAPILQEFLDSAPDASCPDAPLLPVAMAGHGLYEAMQLCIPRIVAPPTPAAVRVLIVLSELHAQVYQAIAERLALPPEVQNAIKLGGKALADDVQRAFVRRDDWIYDARSGLPEHDNPDNLVIFLGIIGCEIRFNMWLEQMEIRGGNDADLRWFDWTYIDDTIVAELRMRALREKTRFKMGKDFTWDALLSLSRKNKVDPVLSHLKKLQAGWDGTKRLAGWLESVCGVADDIYHRTASEIIIGGMVRRIRQPGCKHDFLPVFFGPQGTGKSTIAKIIADMGQSTLAEIDRRSAEWFSDEVMLGDESKELVLSLAGKCLVEIGEMGQRSSANEDHAKAMLSRQVDRGRTAYSRSVVKRPRRNVFFGTVNGDTPLSDTSGLRRFLPVAAPHELDLQWLSDNIAQLIGEAATMEAKGATFAMPKEVYAIAAMHQEAARAVSDVEARLSSWFAETAFTGQAFVSTDDLAELCDLAGWRGVHAFRNGVMKRLGFREVQPYLNGVRTRGWLRGAGKAEAAVRYTVGRTQEGRVRVGVRAGVAGEAGACPPLPY